MCNQSQLHILCAKLCILEREQEMVYSAYRTAEYLHIHNNEREHVSVFVYQ